MAEPSPGLILLGSHHLLNGFLCWQTVGRPGGGLYLDCTQMEGRCYRGMQKFWFRAMFHPSSHHPVSPALQNRRQEERRKENKKQRWNIFPIWPFLKGKYLIHRAGCHCGISFGNRCFISPSSLAEGLHWAFAFVSVSLGGVQEITKRSLWFFVKDAVRSLKGKNETTIEGQNELT